MTSDRGGYPVPRERGPINPRGRGTDQSGGGRGESGSDPEASAAFHGIHAVIRNANAEAFLDGTHHGRGRARQPLHFAGSVYRYNRRRV